MPRLMTNIARSDFVWAALLSTSTAFSMAAKLQISLNRLNYEKQFYHAFLRGRIVARPAPIGPFPLRHLR